jgi:predicted DNA-binding transcriptional regulator AlpA
LSPASDRNNEARLLLPLSAFLLFDNRLWKALGYFFPEPGIALAEANMQESTLPQRVLTTRQAAAYCGQSARTLEAFRLTGRGPRFLKLGRSVRYSVDDLEAWLAASRRRSTSDDGSASAREGAG